MLASNEVCQRLQAVDISLLLATSFGFIETGNICGQVTNHTAPHAVLTEFVESLGLGGTSMRVFCRKLMPHQGIAPHVDSWIPADQGWRRFQVPITSHQDIVMRWPDDDVSVHLEPGYLYEVRFDRLHEVVNETDCERIHLQIDQIGATV